ncbi:MAG: DUF3558 domain-containing protein, partial [Actinomycetota bacterium]|nr:DUF3558 domain-containing protein [Actinomycetota bacterium]
MRRAPVAALVLFAAGCSSQTAAPALAPVAGDASRVDMCTVLTDAELTGLGLELASRKYDNRLGEVGCRWAGQPFTLYLARGKDTVAQYRARRDDPAFTSFADNTVNGRTGARLSVEGDRRDCTQLVDGGPVGLVVSVVPSSLYIGPPIDSCAEA